MGRAGSCMVVLVTWLMVVQIAQSAASAGSCYDHATHNVACNVAKADCSGSHYAPGYVSARNGCCHCQASCVNVSSSCAYYDATTTSTTLQSAASAGSCYDHATHNVACNVAKADCSGSYYAPGYVSARNGCCHCQTSCVNVSSSCAYYDATTTSTTSPLPVYGCSSVASLQCSCSGTKQSCEAMGNTWTAGCTSCQSATTTVSNLSGARQQRPMLVLWLLMIGLAFVQAGSGCYDHIDTHKCDCTVTEQHCKEVREHTWTDGCRTCDAAVGENHPECDREHSWGCFSDNRPTCMCNIFQVSCNKDLTNDLGWTHQCWSCCHESVWGCYMTGAGCHCDIAEGACKRDFPQATWSNKCHQCNLVDPEPEADKEDEDNTVVFAIAVATSCVFLIVVIATVAVVMYCMRMKQKSAAAIAGQPAHVVVGVPVDSSNAHADQSKPS